VEEIGSTHTVKYATWALAMSDVLVAIVGEPLWMVQIFYTTNRQSWQSESDIAMFGTMYFFVLLSLFNIVSVSIDRYVAVFHPLWYQAKATCKTHLLVAIAVCAVTIITCTPMAIISKTSLRIVSIIYIALMGLALTITIYCNLKIFGIISTCRQRVAALTNGDHETSRHFTILQMQEKIKAVTIAIITVIFFICYTPFTVYAVIIDLKKATSTSSDILGSYWTIVFVFLNSMLNRIIYCVRLTRVRIAVKQLIRHR